MVWLSIQKVLKERKRLYDIHASLVGVTPGADFQPQAHLLPVVE